MKKIFAVAAVLVVAAIIIAACSSDGGGGGLPPATITSDTQAKTSTAAAMGAMEGGVGGLASGMTGLSSTATSGATYAKRFSQMRLLQAKDASGGPSVQAKMNAELKKAMTAPTIKKAIAKARSLKKATINDSYPCASGSMDVVGSTNYTDGTAAAHIWDVTITFNNCNDFDGTYYYETTGSIRDAGTFTYDSQAASGTDQASLTMNNVVMKTLTGGYTASGGTLMFSYTMNATFAYDDNWTSTALTGNTDGTVSANGSFVWALNSQGTIFTLTESFGNLSGAGSGSWIDDGTGTGTETGSFSMNGGISISGTYGGESYSFTESFANLTTKYTDTYVTNAWTKSEVWVNGTVSFAETPVMYADCANGSYTFTTADATPLTWTAGVSLIDDWCPDNGTIKINTITVDFTGAGTGTIDWGDGTPVAFTNCELSTAGSVCGGVM